jgi:hypothetical protein
MPMPIGIPKMMASTVATKVIAIVFMVSSHMPKRPMTMCTTSRAQRDLPGTAGDPDQHATMQQDQRPWHVGHEIFGVRSETI